MKRRQEIKFVFFKDLFSFRATALIFELNQGRYITLIEFQYGSHSPPIEGVFEKTNIACFYLHFGKFNFRAKLYSLYITIGAKRLHVWHPRGILNRNLFLVYPWPYIKFANIYDTPKCFLFVVTNLTANFFGFLLLPGKVYADVINGLQYRVAKMQTKSEMYAKYGHAIYF